MNENNKQNYFKENRMDEQEKYEQEKYEQEKYDSENKAFYKRFKKMFNYEDFHKNYPREWDDIFNGKTTEVKNENKKETK